MQVGEDPELDHGEESVEGLKQKIVLYRCTNGLRVHFIS
jgi:hypothetical protein